MADDLETLAATLEADADAVESAPEQEQQAPPDPGPTTAEILEPVLAGTFEILAPAWGVSEPEINQLSVAYGQVIDKYFPDVTLGCEVTAIICTVAVVGPRLGQPRKLPEPGEREEEPGAGKAAPGNSQFPPEGQVHE